MTYSQLLLEFLVAEGDVGQTECQIFRDTWICKGHSILQFQAVTSLTVHAGWCVMSKKNVPTADVEWVYNKQGVHVHSRHSLELCYLLS